MSVRQPALAALAMLSARSFSAASAQEFDPDAMGTFSIIARDPATGEIMASAKGEGVSKRSGLMLGGGGGGWGGGALGEIDMGSSDYRETILGEATEIAVKDVSAKLVAARSRLVSEK